MGNRFYYVIFAMLSVVVGLSFAFSLPSWVPLILCVIIGCYAVGYEEAYLHKGVVKQSKPSYKEVNIGGTTYQVIMDISLHLEKSSKFNPNLPDLKDEWEKA